MKKYMLVFIAIFIAAQSCTMHAAFSVDMVKKVAAIVATTVFALGTVYISAKEDARKARRKKNIIIKKIIVPQPTVQSSIAAAQALVQAEKERGAAAEKEHYEHAAKIAELKKSYEEKIASAVSAEEEAEYEIAQRMQKYSEPARLSADLIKEGRAILQSIKQEAQQQSQPAEIKGPSGGAESPEPRNSNLATHDSRKGIQESMAMLAEWKRKFQEPAAAVE